LDAVEQPVDGLTVPLSARVSNRVISCSKRPAPCDTALEARPNDASHASVPDGVCCASEAASAFASAHRSLCGIENSFWVASCQPDATFAIAALDQRRCLNDRASVRWKGWSGATNASSMSKLSSSPKAVMAALLTEPGGSTLTAASTFGHCLAIARVNPSELRVHAASCLATAPR